MCWFEFTDLDLNFGKNLIFKSVLNLILQHNYCFKEMLDSFDYIFSVVFCEVLGLRGEWVSLAAQNRLKSFFVLELLEICGVTASSKSITDWSWGGLIWFCSSRWRNLGSLGRCLAWDSWLLSAMYHHSLCVNIDFLILLAELLLVGNEVGFECIDVNVSFLVKDEVSEFINLFSFILKHEILF